MWPFQGQDPGSNPGGDANHRALGGQGTAKSGIVRT